MKRKHFDILCKDHISFNVFYSNVNNYIHSFCILCITHCRTGISEVIILDSRGGLQVYNSALCMSSGQSEFQVQNYGSLDEGMFRRGQGREAPGQTAPNYLAFNDLSLLGKKRKLWTTYYKHLNRNQTNPHKPYRISVEYTVDIKGVKLGTEVTITSLI